jgi:hypothetical protein
MHTAREIHSAIPTPQVMRNRPLDHRGFSVPWFVTEKDENGRWDFVHVHPARFQQAIKEQVCWVSGARLGGEHHFLIGPMCVINRVAADPPVRFDMALWSVRVCPFLSRPLAKRSKETRDEEAAKAQRGNAILRNPGVTAIYTVKRSKYHIERVPGGYLFRLGKPQRVTWWREGRRATLDEVQHSIETGLPLLQKEAEAEGPEAIEALQGMIDKSRRYLPLPGPTVEVLQT